MGLIDEAFILATDTELVAEGLKLHQRPFHVVMRWMTLKCYSGDVFDPRIWEPLMESYRKLYPSGGFSIPPMLSGGVAIRDQMYLVRVPLGYGTVGIDPLKLIEIPRAELELVFRHFPEQGWRAFYGACDALDFAYGVDDLVEGATPKPELFVNARSNVAATTRILAGDVDIDAAVQSGCLSAELAMKGALAPLGAGRQGIEGPGAQSATAGGKAGRSRAGPKGCAAARRRTEVPELRRGTLRRARPYARAANGARDARPIRRGGCRPTGHRPAFRT